MLLYVNVVEYESNKCRLVLFCYMDIIDNKSVYCYEKW